MALKQILMLRTVSVASTALSGDGSIVAWGWNVSGQTNVPQGPNATGECDPCDMNCDGVVNAFDIEPFIELLFGGGKPCDTCTGDTNDDGVIDASDIDPFLECLFP